MNSRGLLSDAVRTVLAELLRRGVAVLHDGEACRFVAHRSVDAPAALDAVGKERLGRLAGGLPRRTLYAPVSQEQERSLRHSEDMGLTAWNLQHIHALPCTVDAQDITARLRRVAMQQDILRTSFLLLGKGGGVWAQAAGPEPELAVEEAVFDNMAAFQRFLASERRKRLDISRPPWKFWLCRLPEGSFLGIVAHHAVADAFTPGMLLLQLWEDDASEVKEQYWQYSLNQWDDASYRNPETVRFWRERLAGLSAMRLGCMADPAALSDGEFHAAAGCLETLPETAAQGMAALQQEHDVTLAHVFTAAVAAVLVHGMGNDQAVLHLASNQRDRLPLLRTLGDFTNILVDAVPSSMLQPQMKVADVLRAIAVHSAQALDHAKVDFAELLSLAGLNGYGDFFRQVGGAMLNVADLDAGEASQPVDAGKNATPAEADGHALATLFFQVLRSGGRVHLLASWRKHLFDAGKMRELTRLIAQLAGVMAMQPDSTLGKLLDAAADSLARLPGRRQRAEQTAARPVATPLSEGQKGLWLLQQLHPQMTAYNIPIALRIREDLAPDLLKRAFVHVLRDNPILLTAFTVDEAGQPAQYVDWDRPIPLQRHDAAGLDEAELQRLLAMELKTPFRLEQEPLVRAHLYRRDRKDLVFLCIVHHSIFDGASIGVFLDALFAAYGVLARGEQLPEDQRKQPEYYDFVRWERRFLAGPDGVRCLAFWQERLAGGPPVLDLPNDLPRPVRSSYAGATCTTALDFDLTEQLRSLAREREVSLFVLLLGAYTALLHRYTQQEDMVVGLPVLGRPGPQFSRAMGYFVNTVPLRARVSGEMAFSQHLADLQLAVARSLDHAAYPLPRLVEALGLQPPVFQTVFVLQQGKAEQKDTKISYIKGLHQEGDHDLSLEVVDAGGGLELRLSYATDLFRSETAERFLGHFTSMLRQARRNADQRVGECDYLDAAEKYMVLHKWNKTAERFPADKLIRQLFKTQARKTPDAAALLFKNRSYTYAQLHNASLQLAKQLQQQGAGPDVFVGLCMERGPEMLVCLLAALQSGGVFTPLDPQAPDERLQEMLQDSGARVLLTSPGQEERMQGLAAQTGCAVLPVGPEWLEGKRVEGRLDDRARPNDPAYMVYTSGSTGKPKGVLVSHGSLRDHCLAAQKEYKLSPADRVLQFAALHVDAALEQILPPLISGAAVVLRDDPVWTVKQFRIRLQRYKITVADIPPVYVHEALQDEEGFGGIKPPRSLRLVICGGEPLQPETVRLWRSMPHLHNVRLLNAYGPTETTITSTVYAVPREADDDEAVPVPIGRPMANERAYVLDPAGRLCAIGVPGELHLAGAGVALGYHNRPQLTRERFIPDILDLEARMYKTGDLARWRLDGNLEYLGRLDRQVKVRGFRVELGDVESALAGLKGVRQAAVVPGPDGGLLACVIPAGDSIDREQLRSGLRERLPEYMVPGVFVLAESIPLTAAGKTDEQELRRRAVEVRKTGAAAEPMTQTEKALAALWAGVLGVERVGLREDFFEVGGHSLLAVRLASGVEKRFGVSLPLSALLQAPTVAQMAQRIDAAAGPQLWSPLADFGVDGPQQPLYLAHPVGGTVLAYRELAALFQDERPLYGLQAPGVNGGEHPGSIAGLARLFREAVRTVQPRGPYHVGGWSMGGLIAWEMALQWEEEGETVSTVLLFDTYTPGAVQESEAKALQAAGLGGCGEELALALGFAAELGSPQEKIKELLKESTGGATEFIEKISAFLKVGDGAAHFLVYKANVQAMRDYRLESLRCPAVLFCAEERGEGELSAAPGWNAAGLDVDAALVPGSHYTMVAQPHARTLHAMIAQRLAAARD